MVALRAGRLALLAVAIACSASLPCLAKVACPSAEEFEALGDRLADSSLALAECRKEAAKLKNELDSLRAGYKRLQSASPGGCALRQDDQDVRSELSQAQEELAATEERLSVATEQLAEDESAAAASGRDLVAALQQLRDTRIALVDARQRLAEAEKRLQGSSGPTGSCQAVLLDLQECRDNAQALHQRAVAAAAGSCAAAASGGSNDSDGCALEERLLAQTRARIAELAEENGLLRSKLEQAVANGGTNCGAASLHASMAPLTDTAAARISRRTEVLQSQMLSEALAEVQQLEEANRRLQSDLAAMARDVSSVPRLKASLEEAKAHSARLSQELGVATGRLSAAQEQIGELQAERQQLRSSLGSSQTQTEAKCQALLRAEEAESQRQLAAAQKRLTAAEERAEKAEARVAQLEEANRQLYSQVGTLNEQASVLPMVRESLQDAEARTIKLSEELATTKGSLRAAQQQVAHLQDERDELRASLSSSQGQASACLEVQRHLSAAEAEFQQQLGAMQARLDTCNDRLTAAEDKAASQLGACQHKAAKQLAAVEQKAAKQLAVAEQKGAKQLAACEQKASEQLAASEQKAAQREAAAQQDAAQRLAAAGEESARRLQAAQAALEAAEQERAALAAGKREAEAARLAAEGARLEAELAQKTAEAELRIFKQSKEAEVERLMLVLNKQEEAERELRAAEELRRQAETGWLPLWAQRQWQDAKAAAHRQWQSMEAAVGGALAKVQGGVKAAWARLQSGVMATWQAAVARIDKEDGLLRSKAQPAINAAVQAVSQAADKAWAGTLRPLLLRSVQSWPQIEAAASQKVSSAVEQAQVAAARAQQQAVAAKAAADAVVLQQLKKVPQLHSLATPAVAGGLVWGLIAVLTLPIALAVLVALGQYLLYRLSPASVEVQPPGSSGAWGRLESALGYQFEQDSLRKAALADDVEGASGRLAWLGSALLQLVAAEAAFKQQPEAAGPEALQRAAQALAGPAAVAARAECATLPRLVVPGFGAKSCRAAASKAAELYTACMGAAYVDSGFKLDAARKVFKKTGQAANGSAQE